MSQSANNKRIAKNTIFLYIRMLLIMAVSLYTSRVVLKTLGVEDFGIYNVVGGLASSFAFFSSSLSNATQRFLNVELGKNDIQGVSRIFSLSLLIYVVIVVVVVVIAECVGIWMINNKLVIPLERLNAANWVFQAKIIGLAVTLIVSVFDSVLIARENMKIYAFISVIEVLMKLFIVYTLNWVNVDKLKLYAILFLFAHISVKIISVLYCAHKYSECKFKLFWDTGLFRKMFRFIGWNGLGTAVWMINEQGIGVILNIFFGPLVNAARGVSMQISSAVNNFSNNFFTAIRPQIVKSYAGQDYEYFAKLINVGSKYSFFLMWLLCLPIIMRSGGVLSLWLHDVPDYAAEFVQWILLFNCVNVLTNPFWSGVQAVGNLKKYIIVGSLVFFMAFPISFVFLKLGCSPVIVFKVLTIVRIIYLFVVIFVFCQLVTFSFSKYFKQVIYPILKVFLLSGGISMIVSPYIGTDFCGILLMTLICLIITIVSIYFVGVSRVERDFFISKMCKLREKCSIR